MMRRSVITIALLTALCAGAVGMAQPGYAVGAFDLSASNRGKVQRLAELDARSEVQAAAWSALLSKDVDAAVTAFLAPGGGFVRAKNRSAENQARNADLIRRVLASVTPATSPAVYAAATRASYGTVSEQDAFVTTGWDEAVAADESSQGRHDAEVAKQAQADRDYVASLAVHDPGAWVRAAAQRAGKSDADLAEFFAYEWASAARGDEQAHRVRVADQDVAWESSLTRLVQAAQDAEAALANAEGAALEKARAAAVEAWQAVGGQAATAGQGWSAEAAKAAEQGRSWHVVAGFAHDATTAQDWKTVSANAGSAAQAWAGEQAWAESQARQWQTIADAARANESRVTTAA